MVSADEPTPNLDLDRPPPPAPDANAPMAARILDAASALYIERGREGTTLSAIAERAGVSRPTVYKHLGDRTEVATALIDREVARFFTALIGVLAEHDRLDDRLVEGLAFAVEYARDDALLQRLLEIEPDRVVAAFTLRAEPVLERTVALPTAALAGGIEAGEVVGIDADVAAEWMGRIALSLILTPSVTRDLDDPDQLRGYLTSLLAGHLVAARAQPGA